MTTSSETLSNGAARFQLEITNAQVSNQDEPGPFTEILCAVDFDVASAVAIREALELARQSHGRATLLHVLQEQACGFNMKCNWIALDRSARMVEGRKSFRFNSSTANSRAAPMARCLL